jgi:hypothetical protein
VELVAHDFHVGGRDEDLPQLEAGFVGPGVVGTEQADQRGSAL